MQRDINICGRILIYVQGYKYMQKDIRIYVQNINIYFRYQQYVSDILCTDEVLSRGCA